MSDENLPSFDGLEVGQVVATREVEFTRDTLVRYAGASGDFNPIHINPYFSDFASLPATITHGLWSSAATRRYVETVVARSNPERVLACV